MPMTDAAISYREDVVSRSVQKKSAAHKNNGSAVTKLGNKRMTNKEIIERHGPVETYDLNIFMPYDKFRAMPKDLQVEYVNNLQDKYDVGLKQLAQYLFHVDEEVLTSGLRINGILSKCNASKRRAKSGLRTLLEDIDEQRRREEFAKSIDISDAKAREKETCVPVGFITYEEYVKFSPEDRLKYINGLMTKWNVGTSMISTELFGKSASLLSGYFSTNKMSKDLKKLGTFARSPIMMQNYNKAFSTAVKKWKEERTETPEMKTDVPVEEPKTTTAEKIVETIVTANAPKETPKSDAFQGSRFIADYTALGVDGKQLEALINLFDGKTVHVRIQITEVV